MTAYLVPALAAMLDGIPAHPAAPCSSSSWLGHSDFARERRKAAEKCGGCPIALECLRAAEARGERWGVWGGVDLETKYRADHSGDCGPRKREPARCGTESGYKAHRRVYAQPCAPCREAHCIYMSEYREARRAAAAS